MTFSDRNVRTYLEDKNLVILISVLTQIDFRHSKVAYLSLVSENNLKFFSVGLAHFYLPLIPGEDILITHTKLKLMTY